MSQRGSYVSEFIYCEKCAALLRGALDEPGTIYAGEPPRIVSGLIKGGYLGEEATLIRDYIADSGSVSKFCCEVRVVVIPEDCPPVLLQIKGGVLQEPVVIA